MDINDTLELLLLVLAIIAVFGCITLVILCSEKKSESRTDWSRGRRSNFTYVDEIDFSRYMNPPEENTSTDEEPLSKEYVENLEKRFNDAGILPMKLK
jgi:hypothetical protein